MDQEASRNLLEKHPELFEHPESGELTFFFECGDGWCDLIESVLSTIKRHVNSCNEQLAWSKSRGLRIEDKPMMWPEIVQVKEKFGGLRIYADNTDPYVSGIIALAEAMSFHICEACGNRGGRSSRKYYISTLCASCDQKRDSRDPGLAT